MAFGSKQNAIIAESSVSRLNFPVVVPSSSACPSLLSSYPTGACASSSSSASASASSLTSTNTSKRVLTTCKTVNGWIEAMYASSPPHSRSLMRTDPFEKAITDAEMLYRLWVLRHPSALVCFDRIFEEANGKQIVLFLDYDGTLSPIVDNPDHAFMSESMRATVKDVAMHFPVAIISGRCRDKVYDFVQLPELYYAGSHGMDIMGPSESRNGVKPNGTRTLDVKGNKVILFQPDSSIPSTIEEVCRKLIENTRLVDGVRIDNNKFCASVHFRCVKEEDWSALAEQVKEVVQAYPNLCITQGRKVLEIRPAIAWNKGKALKFLLKSLGLEHRDDIFPVYIGDDRTDEDAFRVLNEMEKSLSILVSSAAKNTAAIWSLRNPCEVMEFLKRLANWRVKLLNDITNYCNL